MTQTRTASALKFRPDASGYIVEDRATGAVLGRVTKCSRYYNIAPRGLWVHYWTASTGPGQPVADSNNNVTHFRTRAEAAQAVTEAAVTVPEESATAGGSGNLPSQPPALRDAKAARTARIARIAKNATGRRWQAASLYEGDVIATLTEFETDIPTIRRAYAAAADALVAGGYLAEARHNDGAEWEGAMHIRVNL